ncbi:hypothetical protein AGMMS49545_18320 [Betaproteobacteria bacterium]|nr:hypothetical protein AGMMS49545_18320 [Betaproteobacteria bacterium]GHU41549.1 hypothetical protein AGMMS50289_04860 [Betaproteobacteria bacterium]
MFGYSSSPLALLVVFDLGQFIPIRMRSETRRLPEDSAIARQGEIDKGSLLMRIGITCQIPGG